MIEAKNERSSGLANEQALTEESVAVAVAVAMAVAIAMTGNPDWRRRSMRRNELPFAQYQGRQDALYLISQVRGSCRFTEQVPQQPVLEQPIQQAIRRV